MAKTKKYTTACSVCESPVYYYEAVIDMGALENKNAAKNKGSYQVICKCTGESLDKTEHERTYTFPNDFTLIG